MVFAMKCKQIGSDDTKNVRTLCSNQLAKLGFRCIALDELESEVWNRIIDAIPNAVDSQDWIVDETRKAAQALKQRNRRLRLKLPLLSELKVSMEPVISKSPLDQLLVNERWERLKLLPKDEFETDLLSVWLGTHPAFARIPDFIKSQRYWSQSQAYRKLYDLKQRIAGMLDDECYES
jgi:hypothetical protein